MLGMIFLKTDKRDKMNTKEKYEKVFEMISDLGLFKEERLQLQSYAERHIFQDELRGYGIEISSYNANGWCYSPIDDYAHIITLDGEDRTISWPDDDKQICGRFLKISFSTGAYIFGEDCPQEFFQRFFGELKNIGHESVDSANKCLYFSMENAGNAYESYKVLLKKYREENRIDALRRRAKKAEDDLAKIVAQLPPAGSP